MNPTATSEAMGEWRSVLIKHGTQFVINTGTIKMQVLYAVSWDSLLMVSAVQHSTIYKINSLSNLHTEKYVEFKCTKATQLTTN